MQLTTHFSGAVAQAFSRRILTAASRVRARLLARGPVVFEVDKSALEQVFSEYFGFP
jgi:hypothetical protein